MTDAQNQQTEDDPEVKRFNTKRKPIRFYLDDDLLVAAPKIPAQTMLDLIERHQTLKEEARRPTNRAFDLAMSMFEEVLFDESMETVRRRMKDRENPIDLTDVMDVFSWLMGEKYGLRPTQKSSSSSDSSDGQAGTDGNGTTSTDGAPVVDSILESSPGTDSSTSPTTGPSET